eukprot:8160600-Ditylum_brightwellii.AAC.1
MAMAMMTMEPGGSHQKEGGKEAEAQLLQAMALFSQAEHAMAKAASQAMGEKPPPKLCWGCEHHPQYCNDAKHLWRNCPRKLYPEVAAAARQRINQWFGRKRNGYGGQGNRTGIGGRAILTVPPPGEETE